MQSNHSNCVILLIIYVVAKNIVTCFSKYLHSNFLIRSFDQLHELMLNQKKVFTNLRVILAGHAYLLCIVPILVYAPPK